MSARGKKARLYVKPARAPKWWPRDDRGRPIWAGVIARGAGWVVGDGDLMGAAQIKVAQEVMKMWDVSSEPRFQVR